MNGTISIQNHNISRNRSSDSLAYSPSGNPARTQEQTTSWWQSRKSIPDRLERSLAIESIQSIASAMLRI